MLLTRTPEGAGSNPSLYSMFQSSFADESPVSVSGHPQLVTTLDSRSECSKYYMIYERLHHRDICFEIEHRVTSFVYGEHISRHYMRQVLDAVAFMHSKSVIHRDLKISCVLLGKSDQIKIGGFSAAVILPEKGFIQDPQHRHIGTVHYMSPEVVRNELYGRPVDVWGCGVLLYVLLTGSLPFSGKTAHVCERVLAPPDFEGEKWIEVSQFARQLCQSMLTTDQYKRITIEEALQHPWIQGQIPRSPLTRAVKEMCSFNARRKMQSAINVACNSTLWSSFATETEKHVISDATALDACQVKEMSRVVNNAVVAVQDSIEEAHLLHEDPKYLQRPQVAHDTKLLSLIKLYDKISVELAGSCGKECMSIVATDRGEVGASRLGSEVAAILEHQLNTATSFTPHESKQLRDLLLLNYNFICLLRAHDVIISELFDNQSNCSSPLGATSTGDTRHNSLPSPQTMPTTLSLSGRHAVTPINSTGTHPHSSSHAANSATAITHHHQHIHGTANTSAPNGNCQLTTGTPAAIVAGEGGESNSASSPGSSPLLPAVSSGATSAPQGPVPTEVTRVKQVNFHRNKGEPLGITLKILKTDQVVVSRVMIGGMIHRQKILNEGDEILEINGRSIRRHSEDELRDLLNHIAGDIAIKVTPKQHAGSINSSSYASSGANCHDNNNTLMSQSFFVRAMFDYRPEEDTTSQAAAAFGLAFQARDILQILRHKTSEPDYSVSVQSLNNLQHQEHLKSGVVASQLTENQRWWQARVVCRATEAANSLAPLAEDLDLDKEASLTLGGVSSSSRKVGLVPSCLWRMETIRNEQLTGDKIRSSCGLFSRKKKRLNMIELSEDEIYERVVQIREPVPRRSLLLVGAPGVGRRSIKNSLIHVDHRFAYPKPHTSKPVDSECVDEHGNSLYHHVAHHELVAAANRGEYLEVGRWNDAWFGTKFHTIDRIMQNNLIPVLDIEPDSIKKLRNSKYMPYVVFVDAPRSFDNSSASASRDDASVAQSFEQLLHVSDDIDRHYRALFDMHIENRQLDKTVELIRGAFDRVCTNANEWLPLNWIGGSSSNNTSVASSANNNQHYNTSAVASSSTHLSSNASHVPVHSSTTNTSTS
ncbi:peripheral plasma membrane protein CASK-like isoform X3 [Convolutriloba macropyga]|uniref:peripheral plasma membrane protein CASK-like isoform X3 n=1 Tax=Convolutriloba macropyga TaxID=536237 RepID=UPI003F522DAE